jgi:predicted RND superfamily exporter protein
MFSESDLIRTFGQAGLIATVIALFAVLMLVPILGVLLVRDGDTIGRETRENKGVGALRAFCAWIAARMVHHSGLYSLIGIAVTVGLAFIYLTLEPRYRLADQVPDQQQAVAASERLDAKLTGANPIDILIEFPKGVGLYDERALQTIADVHATAEKQKGIGNVWSVETLRRWLAEKAGLSDLAVLQQYVEILPEHLTRRFVSAEQDSVLVSGRIADIDASELLPVIKSLDGALDAVRAKHPGYRISVTGLSAIAAYNSADMIGKLNRALTVEIIFVAAFIGLAFRSATVMLVSILPGIFPILASGAVLWLLGDGLQFASVVALVVSFGLGLSATIHFLNRLRLEERPGDAPGDAVEKATVLVGPALILTSLVLACGLVVTVFSNLPTLRIFGWLSAFSMLMALVADFLILRPTATYLRQWTHRRRSGRASV